MKEGDATGQARHRARTSPHVAIVGSLLCALAVIVALETMSLLLVHFDILPGGVRIHHGPDQKAVLSQFPDYLRDRDPVLGWPLSDWTDEYDATGARRSPAFPFTHAACVSLYGDSFTYGAGASDTNAWGNRLAELLGCRVANYGVNGYGTDQALLRFRRNMNDESKLVILGFFHEDIRRNVNQYRYYLVGRGRFSFKPRFILGARGLEIVPLPIEHAHDMRLTLDVPERVLRHEWFLPGTKNGPLSSTFPYSRTVLRAALSSEVRNLLSGRPSWSEFYEERHPSQALPVTQEIIDTFAELAWERDKHFVVVIFPHPSSYELFDDEGVNIAAPLIEALIEHGIPVIDLLPAFHERLAHRGFCEITSEPEKCDGHYNAEGYAMVAGIVFAEISRGIAAVRAKRQVKNPAPAVRQ